MVVGFIITLSSSAVGKSPNDVFLSVGPIALSFVLFMFLCINSYRKYAIIETPLSMETKEHSQEPLLREENRLKVETPSSEHASAKSFHLRRNLTTS